MNPPAPQIVEPARQTPLASLRRWAEMVKFSHSIFALPFALMATFLAARAAYSAGRLTHPSPALWQLALIIVCMIAARSAAMTFNRLVDARFDALGKNGASEPFGSAVSAIELSGSCPRNR